MGLFATNVNGGGAINHNDTLGLQGGQVGEYFHLTSVEYALLTGITSVSTGTSNNDKFVTQGYVDDAVSSSDTFLELTDTFNSYTNANALIKNNSTPNGLTETTTTLTGAANQFIFTDGTASLDVSGTGTLSGIFSVTGDLDVQGVASILGDLTIDVTKTLDVTEDCTIDQDISEAASVTHADLTVSNLANGIVKAATGVLSGGNSVNLASEVTGTLPIASVSVINTITALATGVSNNNLLATQGYVDDNAGNPFDQSLNTTDAVKHASLIAGVGSLSSSAILQAISTTKGFAPPAMFGFQLHGIGSPVEGLMGENTNRKTLDIYTGSRWAMIRATKSVSKTASTTVANTTTQTIVSNATVGDTFIYGNTYGDTYVGSTYRFKLGGTLQSDVGRILTLRIRFGLSGSIVYSQAITFNLGAGENTRWSLEADITFRTTANPANIHADGKFIYDDAGTVVTNLGRVSGTGSFYNAFGQNTMNVTAQWNVASATNTVTVESLTIDKVA